MANGTSNSSILTNSECYTSSDSTQSCTEVIPTNSEMVVVTPKMTDWDKYTELVVGREVYVPIYFSISELV